MKICTDATLFGAMAPLSGGEKVLDIGTGTGLLALMAAQLGAAHVTGVELSPAAAEEARDNFADSPWAERLTLYRGSIQAFTAECVERFDLIISNPPFFQDHSKTADPDRRQARHTDHLNYSELAECASALLAEDGLLYLLLPIHAVEDFKSIARAYELHLTLRTDLRSQAQHQPKVSTLTFSQLAGPVCHKTLTIYQSERVYTQASQAYLTPFLLRFADLD